jgi:hypothetical protein
MNALTPVNPGWKPNHRFTYPVVIINANETLIALDNVGCWQILTQHFDDSWRPRVPAQKEKASPPQEANNALHAWAARCILSARRCPRGVRSKNHCCLPYSKKIVSIGEFTMAPRKEHRHAISRRQEAS